MREQQLDEVDRLLRQSYPADGPGAGVLIASAGQPLLMRGYGLADVAAGTPVTPETIFDLASVAKHITAVAVLREASRGTLSLTDPVSFHLPALKPLDRASHRAITLGDLLHHTSGLPEYLDAVKPSQYAGCHNAWVIDWVARQPLTFSPGTQGFFLGECATYSNTNYALLASVVEQASGAPFAEYLRQEFFAPLGMVDTACDPHCRPRARLCCRYDDGRRFVRGRVIPVVGDGNVFSTVRDLRLWEAELRRPTRVDPAWLARAYDPGRLDAGRPTDYAAGWYVRAWPGRRVAWHGGSWDGVSACYSRWLDDDVSLILVSNTRQVRACEVIERIETILLDDRTYATRSIGSQ